MPMDKTETFSLLRTTLRIFLIPFIVGLILSNPSISGEIYRWVDENGTVHFSDSPTDHTVFKENSVTVTEALAYQPPSIESNPIKEEGYDETINALNETIRNENRKINESNQKQLAAYEEKLKEYDKAKDEQYRQLNAHRI